MLANHNMQKLCYPYHKHIANCLTRTWCNMSCMYTMTCTPGMLFLSQDETLKIEYQLLHFLGIIFWEYKLQDNVSDRLWYLQKWLNVLINRICQLRAISCIKMTNVSPDLNVNKPLPNRHLKKNKFQINYCYLYVNGANKSAEYQVQQSTGNAFCRLHRQKSLVLFPYLICRWFSFQQLFEVVQRFLLWSRKVSPKSGHHSIQELETTGNYEASSKEKLHHMPHFLTVLIDFAKEFITQTANHQPIYDLSPIIRSKFLNNLSPS